MSTPPFTRREVLAGSGWALAGLGLSAAEAAAQQRPEPAFRLGAITYNVPKDWDLPTLCKLLPQAGLDGVEFRTTHRHGVEPTLNAMQRAEVKQRCADAGFRQLSLGTVCEFHSPDAGVVRKNIETCAEFAALARDIGARGIKVRPNGLPAGIPVEKTLEQIGRALQECGKIAADHGVEIWVEVHGAGTQEPANMRKMLDLCGHRSVGITWNSNPTDVKNGSVKESFELLRPYIRCVHINNLWGPYPYRELFSLLRAADYRGYCLCEVATPVSPENGVLFFQCYKGLWRELASG